MVLLVGICLHRRLSVWLAEWLRLDWLLGRWMTMGLSVEVIGDMILRLNEWGFG